MSKRNSGLQFHADTNNPQRRWLARGDAVALIALLIYAVLTFGTSPYTSSFHDFLGGRFPVADGFDWLKDSLNAASGYNSDYGSKRPLNVPFNVFFLWLGDRFFSDPLPGSLLIKRLIALGSILLLTAVVRLRLSIAASFLVGFLLISSLGNVRLPILAELLGHSLGYTIGTELTAFILVVSATSLLLLACFNLDANKPRLSLVGYCFGLLLLTIATLMRPGTLLLTPAVIAMMTAPGLLKPQPGRSRADKLRALLRWGLAGVMTLLLAKGLEVSMFNQLKTTCGAIGSNQGYSLLGMSVGGNFRDGLAIAKSLKFPECDRRADSIYKRLAFERIRADPRPFLLVIWKNTVGVARNLSLLLPAIVLAYLAVAALMTASSGGGSHPLIDQQLEWLSWLSLSGCFAMALFGIAFLGEAGWRPMVPYVVFPAIAYGVLAELICRTVPAMIRRLRRPLLLRPPETSADHGVDGSAVLTSPNAIQNLLALTIALALMASAVLGLGLIKLGALGYRGYGFVSGTIERPGSWLREWQTYNRISPSMSVMYDISLEGGANAASLEQRQSATDAEDRICVNYKRQQLPWDFPYGTLRIRSGHCTPTN
jgi:hypothetical protein